MNADHVEISWDASKKKWLVRIEVGSEVIRRHCDQPKDADEQKLRTAAAETVTDEGYQFESANIAIHR
jgi:hypothetical protein